MKRVFFQYCEHINSCCFRSLRISANITSAIHIMPYYAVARGRTTGIYMTWGDCEAQVKGFSGARYKKFDSVVGAEEFISTVSATSKGAPSNKAENPSQSHKRNYSTANNYSTSSNDFKKSVPKRDPDDGCGAAIAKQLDELEKKVNNFGKGVDKIIKKSTHSGRQTILIEPPAPKKSRSSSSIGTFEEDNEGYVQVYTDGACSSNGKLGARAGLGVYWGSGHHLNTSEPVSGRATNNCGEIQAATCAIRQAIKNGVPKLTINTDSKFLINAVTKWMPGWKRKGWRLGTGEPVKNEIDFKELDSVSNQVQIKWNYVAAHKGIHGNEMADQLAKAGASKYNK